MQHIKRDVVIPLIKDVKRCFDMFHVLRPGYTIPQNHSSRTPSPQILGTWKIFEKFCDPDTPRAKSDFSKPRKYEGICEKHVEI